MVGNGFEAAGESHALVWRHGTTTELGTLGGSQSLAHAINPRGDIVGHAETQTGFVAAFLYTHGTMIELPAPATAVSADARLIDESGHIIAGWAIDDGWRHVMIWRRCKGGP